jgi:hypothetical protein
MNLNENFEFTYGGKLEVQSYTCIKQLKKSHLEGTLYS